MITNEEITVAIAKHARENMDDVLSQFSFEDGNEEALVKKSSVDPECWDDLQDFSDGEYDEYEVKDGLAERIFDCEPLDDQLRAYVYLKKDFSEIVEISIVGE